MNEINLLRDAGPEAPVLSLAACSAARAALLTEIRGTGARRWVRMPSRAVRWRVGIGLAAAVAAVWSATVVVAERRSWPAARQRRAVGVQATDLPAVAGLDPSGLGA